MTAPGREASGAADAPAPAPASPPVSARAPGGPAATDATPGAQARPAAAAVEAAEETEADEADEADAQQPAARVATASMSAPHRPPADDAGLPVLLLPGDPLAPGLSDGPVDRDALRAHVDAGLAAALDDRARRKATVAALTEARRAGETALARAFAAKPRAARPLLAAQSRLTDALVTEALRVATDVLHPLPNPTRAEQIAVLAVGGYGRAEMAPHSDVDLLFLTPWKTTGWAESVVESTLYMLWDLKLKVGHATRSVDDCLRLGREDVTIRTSLLEHRFLCGDAALAEDLRRRLDRELFGRDAQGFIEAKLAERAERHRRQGGQRYVLEPNVKEGKGGLRDLQTLYWIAKHIHRVKDAAELVELGMFAPEEYARFREAEDFLWTVRCHLHMLTGRASDQLSFDMQLEVAERLGFADAGGRRGVEHFMQAYFRQATRVGELTRIFLTALEAAHVKRLPRLVGLLRRRRRVRAGYKVVQGRLSVARPDAFLADPLNLLRVFDEALRTELLLHPDAMRLLAASLHRFDADLRNSPEANRIFLDMLLRRGNPERALRRMNEIGVLGAFIPEFERIVAMMQFNVYHHFTVDEHTIQCISVLAQLERGELAEELPVAARILAEGVNRKVLYVALLLHDIGKGRREDHSVAGARTARRLAPRLGLTTDEAETVEWLVRHHLLMSDMAQKRDISDPRTVRSFAKAVRSRRRLDLLTVLTVCDIRGVGPGVWNNWKAMLLRRLYLDTAEALETGLEELNRENRESEAKRALRAALPDWTRAELRNETARHYGPYWQGLPTETHAIFARLLRGIGIDEIRIDLHPDEGRDATRACFALADHPGVFARIAGALALVGANVVDARSYTSKDGYATAVFWLQDAEGAPFEESRLPRLRRMIERTFAGEVVARTALRERDRMKRRDRPFRVPTTITFDNEGSEIYTIIEVDTRDRPGLLYDLARTLTAANVQIASALIATYGAQAVDTFYVKDMFGLKLHAAGRQQALERKLCDAVEAGAARAVEP